MNPFKTKSVERNEYVVLLYRFATIMLFYTCFRILFYLFNMSLFPNVGFGDLLTMLRGGLMFDLSAVLYLNILYALLYILPLPFKFTKAYQKFLKIIFITTNSIGFALNSIDLIYYRFIQKRTTYNVINILENETNMDKLWIQFVIDYWYVALIFILSVYVLIKSYSALKPRKVKFSNKWLYPAISVVSLVIFSGFSIVGMRGGYRHSTRPINMAHAGKFVNSPDEMAIVLNTPFCVLRTWNKAQFTHYDFYSDKDELETIYSPIVNPETNTLNKKNVVVIILESFSREHFGIFNKHLDNGNYKGYTPFLDSLSQHSLVFPNAFANGQKSIDAMPSILASIPALVLPYVVSDYSANHINGMPNLLNNEGYTTAFFHGAPNGSMGFDAFAKVAGFKDYLGKSEFNNDDEFDGIWGIWDEPFFEFYADEMNKLKEPFMTSLFSVSSHHPFKVPEKYEGVFPKGTLPVHQVVGYTDNALRSFFNKAQEMPWYDNTLFVITADHSTSPYFKESTTSTNKFQIPLIFYSPGDGTMQGVNNRLAQQIDIMPTALEYIGYKSKPYVAFGNNLLDDNSQSFVINYINNSYQLMIEDYVIHYDGQDIISVFNSKNDPMLMKNIKDSDLEYTKHLPLMKAIIQQYNNRMIEDQLTVS